MKISVGRENLKWTTEVCSKIVNLKSPREEMRCVRIEARAGKAFVQATNLEEWIVVPLDGVAIEHEGFCVVNLIELRAFVKDAQPKRCIEIESDDVAVKTRNPAGIMKRWNGSPPMPLPHLGNPSIRQWRFAGRS